MNAQTQQSFLIAPATTAVCPTSRCSRRLLVGIMLAFLLLLCGTAKAQNLAATGSDKDMWLILPEADKGLTILHRSAQDKPAHFWRVTTPLPGLLTPGGAAASDNKLWLVYNNLMVQSMELVTTTVTPPTRYSQDRFEQPLPGEVTLQALAASSHNLWALVTVPTQAVLDNLEKTEQPAADDSEEDEVPAAGSTEASAESVPVTAAFDPPVTRLVKLDRSQWKTVALPQDWPQGQRAWMVFIRADDAFPVLVAEPLGPEGDKLHVYRHDGQNWNKVEYISPSGRGEVSFLSVQQQLVMARRASDPLKMVVDLMVLRSERKETLSIGQLSIDAPATVNWGVAADGLSVALLMRTGAEPPVMTSLNLQGLQTLDQQPIVIEKPPGFSQDPAQMLMVAVVAISIFLMFIVWRRDPNLDDVILPDNMLLADFGRRIGAAAIDLGPCIFIAMLATGVDLTELRDSWPGISGTWSSMVPGFITIGLYVLHTGISELFTGKTLGKAVCGLQVISTSGKPPNIWQILARNALKSFDLIAFYILPVLAVVGKHRQRLGDLVGKTLVVMPVANDESDDAAGGSKDKSDKADSSSKQADSSDDDHKAGK